MLLCGFGLFALRPILTPFLAGIILAYILNPGANWLVKHKIPRFLAVAMMLTVLLAGAVLLTLLIIPVLQREVIQIQEQLPVLLNKLNETVTPKLREWFGLKIRFDANSVKKFFNQKWAENSEDIVAYVMELVRTGSGPVLEWLANIFLAPIVTFYFLMDWNAILARLSSGVPKRWRRQVFLAVGEIDDLLSQYLRGQLLVMTVLAAYYVLALSMIGVDLALPIGILTGVLIFIPYVGFSIGFLLAMFSGLLQFQTLNGLLATGAVYALGQFIESFFLTPRLVGERIGLHPIAVIFALMAFGYSFGFTGVLLALPLSAAGLVGLKRLRDAYLNSPFYNG